KASEDSGGAPASASTTSCSRSVWSSRRVCLSLKNSRCKPARSGSGFTGRISGAAARMIRKGGSVGGGQFCATATSGPLVTGKLRPLKTSMAWGRKSVIDGAFRFSWAQTAVPPKSNNKQHVRKQYVRRYILVLLSAWLKVKL